MPSFQPPPPPPGGNMMPRGMPPPPPPGYGGGGGYNMPPQHMMHGRMGHNMGMPPMGMQQVWGKRANAREEEGEEYLSIGLRGPRSDVFRGGVLR